MNRTSHDQGNATGESTASQHKVLVLTSTFPRFPGDPQPTFIKDLACHIPGFSQTILAPASPKAALDEEVDGLRVVRFRYAPRRSWELLAYEGGILGNLGAKPWLALLLPGFLLSMVWHIRKLHCESQFALIHAHWVIPQGFAAALACLFMRKPPRILITAHGTDVHAFDGWLGRVIKRFALRRTDAVTAVSTALKRDVEALQSGIEVEVAPMGIYPRQMQPSPGPRKGFCFVGRLVELKGPYDFLQAAALVHRQLGDQCPSFIFAGDGPLRAELEKQTKALQLEDFVHFAGWLSRDECDELLAGSKALIMPSSREGLGLTAVEALALGTPVIAYDFPAGNDLAKMCGGFRQVGMGDVSALAEGMLAMLRDSSEQDLSAMDVLKRFSWDQRGQQYERIYGLMVQKSRL